VLATPLLPSEIPLERLRLRLNGFELEAEQWSGGQRAQVLLLHGLGGNSVTWHGVAPVLAGALEADVLALDLPGFGRSRTGGRSVSVRVLSEIVEAAARSRAPAGTRWILAGNSLGAVLALDLARRAPELVLAASVLAPALPLLWGRSAAGVLALRSWIPASLPWLGGRLVANYMKKTGLPGVVDQPIRALFGDERRLDPQLRERLLEVSGGRLGWAEEAGRAYEQVTWSLGMELLASSGAMRAIREVRCPVLAVRGERDPVFSRGAWEELERLRPDWTYETLADIGHVPQLEAPAAVARCLSTWLRQRGLC
jgi:pimeloyl-ACP methyl ester carboxylesterase